MQILILQYRESLIEGAVVLLSCQFVVLAHHI